MEEEAGLPGYVREAQSLLEPYIKPRHEASKIRRVLSSHLVSQLHTPGEQLLNRPLSLVDQASSLDPSSNGVRGLQREYMRCLRANLKARNDYSTVAKEHYEGCPADAGGQDVSKQYNGSSGMDAFIHLIMQQQKHERLRITQDYIDTLSQKPAANVEHLDPKVALRDVEGLPKVPADVLNNASSASTTKGTDLEELVDQLEKSVLRAKVLLKKEQTLLAKVRLDKNVPSANRGDRIQALGLTRNALINWMEAEMEKAGDGSEDGQDDAHHDAQGKDYIEAQLASIQRQYGRYIEARQTLVGSATSTSELPVTTTDEDASEMTEPVEELHHSQGMQVLYPYLDRMSFMANEQKAAIQQRSHLTISLAKQVKDASQGLDRLGDESHLLPSHPMPNSVLQRKGLDGPLSFNDELMYHEKPDSSDRARAWTYAAEASEHATKDAVLGQLEVGGKSLEESQLSLSGLYQLLGYDNSTLGKEEGQKRDIWTVLDGSLGVIKGE